MADLAVGGEGNVADFQKAIIKKDSSSYLITKL